MEESASTHTICNSASDPISLLPKMHPHDYHSVMVGYKDIDPSELQAMLAQGRVQLVDVRNDAEVAHGIIGGARHIPLSVLPARQDELADDLPLVFYCHSGIRSAHACAFMANQGRDNLFNLRGGVLAWGKAGYPFAARN